MGKYEYLDYKLCPLCGLYFVPSKERQIYCNETACKKNRQKIRYNKQKEDLGIDFKEVKSRVDGKRCLYCNCDLGSGPINKLYCSNKCGKKFRHTVQYEEYEKIAYASIKFNCSQCGKEVTTEEGTKDMRTTFCCESCEKKYWRKPHWEHKTSAQLAFGWQLAIREKSCD